LENKLNRSADVECCIVNTASGKVLVAEFCNNICQNTLNSAIIVTVKKSLITVG